MKRKKGIEIIVRVLLKRVDIRSSNSSTFKSIRKRIEVLRAALVLLEELEKKQ